MYESVFPEGLYYEKSLIIFIISNIIFEHKKNKAITPLFPSYFPISHTDFSSVCCGLCTKGVFYGWFCHMDYYHDTC